MRGRYSIACSKLIGAASLLAGLAGLAGLAASAPGSPAQAFASAPAAANSQDRSVIGKWKLTRLLDFAQISALNEKQAGALVGQIVEISAEEVRLPGRICGASDFNAERVERDRELIENARVTSDLGLPEQVTVIELNCAYAYIKDHNHLVLGWKGAYFSATRIGVGGKRR